MKKIKNVIMTSEANIILLKFYNSKRIIKRIIKKSVNDDRKYFIYNKCEYFLNDLYQKNIHLIEL